MPALIILLTYYAECGKIGTSKGETEMTKPTTKLPAYLERKAARVCELAHNFHTLGTIAHDVNLSIAKVERILIARGLRKSS